MGNWSNPTLTSTYVNFVQEVKDRDLDLAKGLDPALVTATNVVSGMQRWNSANSYWEKYNGTAWAALSSTYAISITGTAANATSAAAAVLVGITDDITTNTVVYPMWATATTGNLASKTSSTKLSFNPSTGILSSTGFSGKLTAISGIYGDFGNATITNVPSFQSNVTNNNTLVPVIPNGTSTLAGFSGYGSSAPANSSFFSLYQSGTQTALSASKVGTGTYGYLSFLTSALERARLTANGGLSFGTSGTAYGTTGQVLTSNGDAPPSWTNAAVPANLAGGLLNQIPYQTAANTTSFITAPSTAATALTWNGTAFVWASASATVASGCVYENSQTISANYTVTSGKSAHSVGPITVTSGVTVTIPSGSRWVIL